jgi:DNA repair protein RadA/Sms
VAGGLRISEPAADLAVAASLISSRLDAPIPPDTVVFGEIGLAGEVRAVSQMDTRLKEAAKLGFARALIPARKDRRRLKDAPEIREIGQLTDLVETLAAGRRNVKPAATSGDRRH